MEKAVLSHKSVQHALVMKAMAQSAVDKVLHPKGLRELSSRLSPPKGWTLLGNDSKSDSKVSDELLILRSALASVYGSKPVPFIITYSAAFSSAGSVLNPVATMLVTSAPEWTALSSLFDEWLPLHGRYEFQAQYAAIPVLSGNACALAIAFDPSDGTVPSTVRELAELKQHRLYRPVLQIGPTGTVVATSFYTKGEDTMLHFPYTMKGVGNESITAAGTVEVLDGWRPTKTTGGTANNLIGYVKTYAEVASPAAGVCLAGIWYHTIHLRSRT